ITTAPGVGNADILGSSIHPDVFRDSVYTFCLQRIADTVSTSDLIYYLTDGTQYARGSGQLGSTAGIDIYFVETVSHTYACDDSIAVPFTVDVCTAVQELADGAVLLGPNPFTDVLTLRSPTDLRYVIYNAVGAELLSGTAHGGAITTLPTAPLAAGLYTVRCTALDGTDARVFAVVKAQ
ncbi:MAG: hypothetical protein ABI373_02590, partial [Flavobacteriales bacterium]